MILTVLARITGGALMEARTALRGLQRHLDRYPSVANNAASKKLEALLALREGKTSDALDLLSSALATFVLAHDTMEAACTRHWIATAQRHAGRDAEPLASSSRDELARLGMLPWPADLELNTPPFSPRSAPATGALCESLRSATERLSVRGLAPRVLRHELVSAISGLFPGCLGSSKK